MTLIILAMDLVAHKIKELGRLIEDHLSVVRFTSIMGRREEEDTNIFVY